MREEEYTSPSKEDLEKAIVDEEQLAFIQHIRRGEIDLYKMTDHDQQKIYKELVDKNIIIGGYAVTNPCIFWNENGDQVNKGLYFLFITATPRDYFNVKDWLRNPHNKDLYRYSAYTTLGKYDFIMRISATDETVNEIIKELMKCYSEENLDPLNIVKIRTTGSLIYDWERSLPNDFPKGLKLDEINYMITKQPMIDPNQIEANENELYNNLYKKKALLGTRCLINTPLLQNFYAFILTGLPLERRKDTIKRLEKANLLDNVIDVFTDIEYKIKTEELGGLFNVLLVCEFTKNGNAIFEYNRWMDRFYREFKDITGALTFVSDSTIAETPDLYNNDAGYSQLLSEYSNPEGKNITLGNAVREGVETPLLVNIDINAFIAASYLLGKSGTGKTNTCLCLTDEFARNGIKSFILSCKGENSITDEEIKSINGIKLSPDDFIKGTPDLYSMYKEGPGILNLNIDDKDKEKNRTICANILNFLSVESNRASESKNDLKFLCILDEIYQVIEPVTGDEQWRKLKRILTTCRQSGLGVIISTQTIQDDWKRCKNYIIHGNDENEVVREKTRIPNEILTQLNTGMLVCRFDVMKGNKLPYLVVKVRKKRAK